MRVEIDFPNEIIHALLVTAQEHSGYWCYDSNMGWADVDGELQVIDRDNPSVNQMEACTLWVEEYDDREREGTGKRIQLNLQRGLQLAANKYPRVLNENELDAETADIFLQLAAFGELIYG